MIKYILTDIEGTTSSIEFVHKVLFPYSLAKVEVFLNENKNLPEVVSILNDLKSEPSRKELNLSECINVFKTMIQNDVKFGPLKALQGLIWQYGYEQGEIKGHVYAEVPEYFKKWTSENIQLGIYSSGSVLAQKLIFGFTEYGNLNTYISHYFDTAVGAKQQTQSYKNIAQALNLAPESILFLSDREEELKAASEQGYQTILLNREREKSPTSQYLQVSDFSQIILK